LECCKDVETFPLSASTARELAVRVMTIGEAIFRNQQVPPFDIDIAINYCFGASYIRFNPLWVAIKKLLGELAALNFDKYWNIYFPYFKDCFLSESSSKNKTDNDLEETYGNIDENLPEDNDISEKTDVIEDESDKDMEDNITDNKELNTDENVLQDDDENNHQEDEEKKLNTDDSEKDVEMENNNKVDEEDMDNQEIDSLSLEEESDMEILEPEHSSLMVAFTSVILSISKRYYKFQKLSLSTMGCFN